MGIKEASGGKGQLSGSRPGLKVPCFPLESLLLVLNRSHVDYFSLDVEGFELPVLKSIPFDKIHIDSFSVEYSHGGRNVKEEQKEFMKEQGYVAVADIHYANTSIDLWVDDLIFMKKSLARNVT